MKQKGNILIQTLLFILVLTILSGMMASITKKELQYMRSYRQQNDTLINAQASLNVAKEWLISHKTPAAAQSTCNSVCIYLFSNKRNFRDRKQWPHVAKNIGTDTQPQYFIIELLASYIDKDIKIVTEDYQITAISWSESNNSQRIVQVVIEKQYDKNNNAFNHQQLSWRLMH